ncbi:PSD1 and planctomycete cytochrome C domain-containing protein [Paludisphaera mucosa]|uniref:PSD1 and planctomycete cytochrome C domain-containing protein n=1 Tax=Paludisphaera mucosa TaxID=3030827 RepID=A0ABT6FBW3_9BACT|nr:PSD1 and planctomycete cytochrome C domain-containing protein [Paludisphaera mucosa]MDG3004991.1 PSD1 and planctomycete cytochrome C domain-containing protein [Paludisphaera mucosa]
MVLVPRTWSRWLGAAACAAMAALGAGASASAEGDAADPRVEAERTRFFEQEVRPLLVAKCQSCHGPDKQKGGLRLDSREALLRGGETGAVVEPGKPGESPLVQAVRYEGLEMPPTGKLEAAQVAALARWVADGAAWPAGTTPADAPRPAKVEKADGSFWSFRPLKDVAPPDPQALAGTPWDGWARNPIDGFVLKGLLESGLTPAPEASKLALVRRATFDLIGLPPTPEEVDGFLADDRADAYERLVDRLLASPRYGERWGRHWLDVVRYAESDGYNADAYRPEAWRYRDYVVRSLDADKPYDRFLAEQVAGDELDPSDVDARIATGFLRLGPYEANQRNVRGQWADILNEITDVVGEAFLGLSVGCARCHDHKFDPIAQADYYRLQAFFTPILPVDSVPLWTDAQKAEHDAKLAVWEQATAEIRGRIADLEKPYRDKLAHDIVAKFTPDLQALLDRADAEIPPYDRQIKALAYRQVVLDRDEKPIAGTIRPEDRPRWQAMIDDLKKSDAIKPAPLPVALGVRDVDPEAPPTRIPGNRRAAEPIDPGFPSVLDPSSATIAPPPAAPGSTGRRLALAEWLNRPDNPLTTRVVVNRAWQHHFGRGIVATSNDFGKLGEAPSHPELLDWLARRFVADGRRFKPLHRLMVTSAAYRQSAFRPESEAEAARLVDPGNRLLWKRPVRRLEAEAIRDAMLSASGELADVRGGPAGDAKGPRRSVDCKVVRNTRDPVLDAFDAPDAFNSAGLRNTTTTVNQTLLLINGPWALDRAKALSVRLDRLTAGTPDAQRARDRARIVRGFRLTVGREPDDDETAAGLAFLDRANKALALVDYCHVLLNASEFLYVD